MKIRHRISAAVALSLFWLPLACSNPIDGSSAQDIRPLNAKEVAELEKQERARKREVRADSQWYDEQLKTAPSYTSEIRAFHVDRRYSYKFSDGLIFNDLHNGPHEFSCIHPTSVIAAFASDGWQLIECDIDQAIFSRNLPKTFDARPTCMGGTSRAERAGRHFQTAIIRFQKPYKADFEIPHSRIPTVKQTQPMLAKARAAEFSRFGLAPQSNQYSLYRSQGAISDNFYLEDERSGAMFEFRVGTSGKDCRYNAIAHKLASRTGIFVDSPTQNIEELSNLLERIEGLLDVPIL